MIASVIRWSIRNRLLVLLASILLAGWGRMGVAEGTAGCAARSL
ncbi:Uncharacterised protein [Serratia fonticola]|uniref:Uncharacterized protein n=1 Tax=Serratia fonticola TaxID=47917 RepID=A0A4V6KT82_SERFO|nr:Uncharacterised protein [Serratia fonticola]